MDTYSCRNMHNAFSGSAMPYRIPTENNDGLTVVVVGAIVVVVIFVVGVDCFAVDDAGADAGLVVILVDESAAATVTRPPAMLAAP